MLKVAAKIADLWLTRGRRLSAEAKAARSAVADLTPAVVVTGGSRGIGAAIANEFARRGYAFVIVARHLPERHLPAGTIAIAVDVTAADAFEVISARLATERLYLDVLVNSAGVGLAGPFVEHESKDIDALLSLNVAALTRLTRRALPGMLARRRGGVLNVSSLGGYAPGPHQAAYYASKGYVLSLTEAIAAENAGSGVRFTVLAPGPVETKFHGAMGADDALYRRLLPALSPEHAARAAYRGFMIGQRVVAPGVVNRLALVLLKLLPHPLIVPIVGWLLRKS